MGRGGRPPAQGLAAQRHHLPDQRRGDARQRTCPRHARPKGGRGGERRQGAAAAKAGGARSRRGQPPPAQLRVGGRRLHRRPGHGGHGHQRVPARDHAVGHATPHPRAQGQHGAPDAAQPGARRGPVQRHEDTGAPDLRAQHPGTDPADGPALLRPAQHHDAHGRE